MFTAMFLSAVLLADDPIPEPPVINKPAQVAKQLGVRQAPDSAAQAPKQAANCASGNCSVSHGSHRSRGVFRGKLFSGERRPLRRAFGGVFRGRCG